jgi:hypothetical protein
MVSVFTTESFLKSKLKNMQARLIDEFSADPHKLAIIERHLTKGDASLTSYALKLHSGEHNANDVITKIVEYSAIPKKKKAKALKCVERYIICFQDATWSLVPHPS